jgi:outer membrane protein
MKTIKLALTFMALIGAAGVYADTLGGRVDVSYWYPKYGGGADSNLSKISLKDNLGFGSQGFAAASVTLEHPVPAIPNIRLGYVDLSHSEKGNLNTTFDGKTFNGGVTTDLNLSNFDLTLYYQLLDNVVSLDLGLDAKVFSGKFDIRQINNPGNFSNTKVRKVVPLLYSAVAFKLPATGLTIGGELAGIAYSGNNLYDAKIRVRKDLKKFFYFELGFRQLGIKLNNLSGIGVNTRLGGPYLTAGIDF